MADVGKGRSLIPSAWAATDTPSGPRCDVLSGIIVLVVEDDGPSREALALVFGHYGARVLATASAAEALRQCARAYPALIVSDIGLPGKDGYALIRNLRARDHARGTRTPAIAVSGLDAVDMTERVRAAGFDEFLPKPVDVPTLLAAARSLLEAA